MRKSALVLPLFLGFVYVGVFTYAHAIVETIEKERFASELATFITESKDSFSELPLSQLQTSYYSTLVRVNPLFGLPNSDTNALKEVVKSLKGSEESIKELLDVPDATVVYPIEFFELLPGLEDARRSLIETPSRDGVFQYHALLTKSFSALRAYLNSLEDTEFVREKHGGFTYLFGTLRQEELTRVLNETQNFILEMEKEEMARLDCFLSFTAGCNISYPEIPTQKSKGEVVPISNTTSLIIKEFASRLDTFSGFLNEGAPVSISGGCEIENSSPYVLWFEESSGLLGLKASSLSELYIYDTDLFQGTIFSDAKRTPSHLLQISGHYYECPNAPLDIARLASASRYHDALSRLALEQSLPSIRGAKIREEIQSFLKSSTISSDRAITLATLILQTAYSNEWLLAKAFGEKEALALITESVSVLNNSGFFENRVATFLLIDLIMPGWVERGGVFNKEYLFSARSIPSILLLPLGASYTATYQLTPPLSKDPFRLRWHAKLERSWGVKRLNEMLKESIRFFNTLRPRK